MFRRFWTFVTTEGLARLLTSEAARAFIWIPLVGIVTAVLGAVSDVPWLYVWICIVAACTMTAVGLYASFLLRQFSSAQHKVQIVAENAESAYQIEDGVLRGTVVYVLTIENRAPFPITIRMESANNLVSDRIESGGVLNYGGIIAPLTVSTFRFSAIDIGGLSPKGFLGQIDVTFVYGVSRLKYELKFKRIAIFANFTEDRYNVRFAHTGKDVEPNLPSISLRQGYRAG